MQILERAEGIGGDFLDIAADIGAQKLADEVGVSESPQNATDRPEKQYETQVEPPQSGPASLEDSQPGPGKVIRDTLADYRWYAAGALAMIAFVAYKGAK